MSLNVTALSDTVTPGPPGGNGGPRQKDQVHPTTTDRDNAQGLPSYHRASEGVQVVVMPELPSVPGERAVVAHSMGCPWTSGRAVASARRVSIGPAPS